MFRLLAAVEIYPGDLIRARIACGLFTVLVIWLIWIIWDCAPGRHPRLERVVNSICTIFGLYALWFIWSCLLLAVVLPS